MAKIHGPVVLLFIALSAVMTWPLIASLDRAVAWPGDPFINTWILDWDWYATLHQPLALFQANAFYPASNSLAYSENLYGIALLLFPLRAAGVSALAAYNIAMLAGFAFSGFGAYLLGRHVTQSAWAGIAAGVFYAFLPFRFTHASQVQHVFGGWLPLLLLMLLRYVERPSWRRGAAFGAVFLMNGLTNIHALLFGSIAIGATVLVSGPALVCGPALAGQSRHDRLKPVLTLAICTAIASALLLPFLLPYIDVSNTYGMERNWHETKKFSAMPEDWLASNTANHAYRVLENPSVNPERWLFPGALCLIVGAFAIGARGRALASAFVWIVLGFLGSLGTHTFFHRFLFAHVLAFRAIRVPARWAMIAYVGLALAVALGTAVLARKRAWVGAAIAAAFVVEMWSAPAVWYMATPPAAPVYRWIAETKPRAILELPIGGDAEYGYMLAATAHHRPMLNGVSGFAPPQFNSIASMAHRDPVPDKLLRDLRRIGCELIVAHGDYIDARTRQWLSGLKFLRKFDAGISGDWVFALEPGPPYLPAGHMFSETAFGFLDMPAPNAHLYGPVTFSGWAMSPYGVREVNLLFNNGLVRRKAQLAANPYLHEVFPFYAATTRPAFTLTLAERPQEIWPVTDVQTEIVDGHGRRVLLQDRFIHWR